VLEGHSQTRDYRAPASSICYVTCHTDECFNGVTQKVAITWQARAGRSFSIVIQRATRLWLLGLEPQHQLHCAAVTGWQHCALLSVVAKPLQTEAWLL
jgi:hypothetical protein